MIKNEKIPGDIHDHVKLCIYLSPGDLRLLWTSFKSFCAQLNPAEPQSATRPITNLCGFLETYLGRCHQGCRGRRISFGMHYNFLAR
jgi:hypothetical protein